MTKIKEIQEILTNSNVNKENQSLETQESSRIQELQKTIEELRLTVQEQQLEIEEQEQEIEEQELVSEKQNLVISLNSVKRQELQQSYNLMSEDLQFEKVKLATIGLIVKTEILDSSNVAEFISLSANNEDFWNTVMEKIQSSHNDIKSINFNQMLLNYSNTEDNLIKDSDALDLMGNVDSITEETSELV